LLIFFILATSYANLQQTLPAPTTTDEKQQPRIVKDDQVRDSMIVVTVKMDGGKPVIQVFDKVVAQDDLLATLRSIVQCSKKVQLLLQHEDSVPYGTIVFVQDKAK